MTQSLSFPRNSAQICWFSSQPAYRWELIGAVECFCDGCRTVRVLNQTVSLLLIIHNATNSQGLSFHHASLNILAATQKRIKRGKKNNLHTIITVF